MVRGLGVMLQTLNFFCSVISRWNHKVFVIVRKLFACNSQNSPDPDDLNLILTQTWNDLEWDLELDNNSSLKFGLILKMFQGSGIYQNLLLPPTKEKSFIFRTSKVHDILSI